MAERNFAGTRNRPPPINPASLMVWCGERYGRVPTSPRESSRTPATLWIRVVSMASSSDIGGKMVGMRLASMVLPAPGGPISKMLWPPAQATSSARFAAFGRARRACPRVLIRLREHCRVSTSTGCRFGRVDQIDGLRQRASHRRRDALDHRGFASVGLRDHYVLDAAFTRGQRGGKCSADRTHAAIERKLAEKHVRIQRVCRKKFPGTRRGQAPWQIERRAFLANVRGSQIDGDGLRRGKIESAIAQRGAECVRGFLLRRCPAGRRR